MPPLGVGRVPYIGAPGCPILPSLHIAPGALWGVSVSHRCVPPVGCPISAASSCWSLVRLAAGLQYGLVVGGSGSRLGVVVGVLGLPGSGMGLGWSGQVGFLPGWDFWPVHSLFLCIAAGGLPGHYLPLRPHGGDLVRVGVVAPGHLLVVGPWVLGLAR